MRICRVPFACIALWLAAACSSAAVAAPAELDESVWIQDLPVVLTPSRLPSAQQDAPAAMSVIDRELIAATGYQDLPRVLRLVPGMQIGQERANTHWVTYHGLSNDFPSEMQVLIDGRSVFSPAAFGGVDWTTLPIAVDEIERVEIVRGTDPVGFGTNAFLGVINIITQPVAIAQRAEASVLGGNLGQRSAHADVALPGEDGGLRLIAEARRSDGFEGLHDGSESRLAALTLDRRLGLQDELRLRLAHRSGKRDAGYPDSIFHNNGLRTDRYRVNNVHLQWRHADTGDSDWVFNLYRNEDVIRDEWFATTKADDLPPRPATRVPLNRNRDSARTGIELQRRLPLADGLRAVWGGELRRDSLDAPFFFFGQDTQNEMLRRLFGSLEWMPSEGWTYHAGLLAEEISDDRPRLAPRLFANWQATPQHTLRAGYSRAWRQRNMFEVRGDIRAIDPLDEQLLVQPYQPNPNLRRARIDSAEIGWLARLSIARGVFDLRLFNERIHDFIVREPVAPLSPAQGGPLLGAVIPPSRYVNLPTPVTLRGIEYELRLQPHADSTWLLTHTLIDRHSEDPAVRERTAPYTASVTWIERWLGNWTTTLTVLRQGPLAGGDGFVPGFRYVARPYTTVDARIAWHTHWQSQTVEVALSGTNLGGGHQEVADRSEQFLHPAHAANETSPAVALTVRVALD